MKKFMFITEQGFTIAPNDEDVENLQVLGFAEGETEDIARAQLFSKNHWIAEKGFDLQRTAGYVVAIDSDIFPAIKKVVDYLWTDEERHYEEIEYPSEHIFLTLKKLKEYLQ